jgi:hypothetical protein
VQDKTDNLRESRLDAPDRQPTPLSAQLYWRKVTGTELAVLKAMLEMGDSSGQFLYPSIPRIAFYTKLSRRTVQNALHGDVRECENCHCPKPADARPGHHKRPWNHRNSLCGRLALEELAPANETDRKAATYRFHIGALHIDEDMIRTAIRRHWKVPIEVIEACPENLQSQMQTTFQFPLTDKEASQWVREHRSKWQSIQRQLHTFVTNRVNGKWTPQLVQQFVEAKALEAGATVTIALSLAKIASGTA